MNNELSEIYEKTSNTFTSLTESHSELTKSVKFTNTAFGMQKSCSFESNHLMKLDKLVNITPPIEHRKSVAKMTWNTLNSLIQGQILIFINF